MNAFAKGSFTFRSTKWAILLRKNVEGQNANIKGNNVPSHNICWRGHWLLTFRRSLCAPFLAERAGFCDWKSTPVTECCDLSSFTETRENNKWTAAMESDEYIPRFGHWLDFFAQSLNDREFAISLFIFSFGKFHYRLLTSRRITP